MQGLISVQTEKIADYTIVAPMDGVVLRRDGEVGEIAEAGQILFRVGVPKPLQVVAEVNEEDIPRVEIGQTVLFRTDAFPDRRLEGKVREITPMGDVVAKTYRIKMALPDDTPLKPGMSVEANVVTREKPDALLIPADAVQGNAVFVLDGATVRKREVKVGIRGTRAGRGALRPCRRRAGRFAGGDRPRGRRARARHRMPTAVNLIFDIALTHVRARVRQTGFAVAGVATGVGFSIMMAALMQGSQNDFIRQLINTLPHITVTDERRTPPPQPAEVEFEAAEIHGLTPEARRPGIKNPLAIMAALEAWMPGAVAPSVKVQAIIRYANHDVATTVTGIDPRREPQGVRTAQADAPGPRSPRSTAPPTPSSSATGWRTRSAPASAPISRCRPARARASPPRWSACSTPACASSRRGHGLRADQDRADPRPGRPGWSTNCTCGSTIRWRRARLPRASSARPATSRCRGRRPTRTCSSTFIIRNIIMYTVVGAILLVASFGTYNIISTITHEKARDIAIMKSLGLREVTVRMIFVLEALIIGLVGALIGFAFGYLLCVALGSVAITNPFIDSNHLPLAYTYVHYLLRRHGGAGVLGRRRLLACAQGRTRQSGRDHPGRHMTATQSVQTVQAAKALIEARNVTRILPGIVPTTLVHDIDLDDRAKTSSSAITGPSGSGKSSLLYLLGLLDLPTSGEVLIHGRATVHMAEEERALTRLTQLGFVFQFHFLLPEFTVLDNVMLPMRALGRLSVRGACATRAA